MYYSSVSKRVPLLKRTLWDDFPPLALNCYYQHYLYLCNTLAHAVKHMYPHTSSMEIRTSGPISCACTSWWWRCTVWTCTDRLPSEWNAPCSAEDTTWCIVGQHSALFYQYSWRWGCPCSYSQGRTQPSAQRILVGIIIPKSCLLIM